MKNLFEILTCPTCFEVKKNCNTKRCKKECLNVCKNKAITAKDKATINLKLCNSCSLCSLICPVRAVDKVSLRKATYGQFYCNKCGQEFPVINNVYSLLPKNLLSTIKGLKIEKSKQENISVDWKFLSYQYYIRYKRFIDYVSPIIKDDTVLDIGCASAVLSSCFKSYIGLDNSIKLVSFASGHVDKPIILADARFIPLRNNSAPFFMARNLLEHTKDGGKIIRELKRVSFKGGFFELPSSDTISWLLDPVNCFLGLLKRKPLKAFCYGYGHINLKTVSDWKEILLKEGFKIIDSIDLGKGVILNIDSFLESLFLSWGNNDSIPVKRASRNFTKISGKVYDFIDKLDPKLSKSWSKLFYVS